MPNFLNFYELANQPDHDETARWELWEGHYNFAAVPPGDQGQAMARQLLEDAWKEYGQHLSVIEKWSPDIEKVKAHLTKVKEVLGYDLPIQLVVIYFVGGFENNAFVAPFDEDRLALCLPIENGDSDITLVHELTHVVHARTAHLTAEWERTIASTILQEGLAAQLSKYVIPGKTDECYIESKKGWLQSCAKKKREIILGIIPFLTDSSSETVTKFTFGNGTTGHEREAYYAGWEIVHSLLEQGNTFEQIAHIKEEKIPKYLNQAIAGYLSQR
ncbi:DUF2268 domain-containing putative Zn-dependent protease [Sporosarcina aquimarina]|uniref:DUF2268 domain-containing putative Zn-dependent protease n=1 Tax=Sporosarcina aquimarina TaxID=114975 RepID=UPI00295F2D77|nr:DUF2268 domain-containing putative Zn-dependent protease [Sporosarcina aquimarina]